MCGALCKRRERVTKRARQAEKKREREGGEREPCTQYLSSTDPKENSALLF